MRNVNGKTLITGTISLARAWAIFDALPREIKEYYWERSVNTWPGGNISPAALAQLKLEDLAIIAPTWGPDHPQASRQVTLKRGKVVEKLQPSDLEDWI
jgi:hypothetical protein